MASFDPNEKEFAADGNSLEITKYPIKRLELSIKKFVKVLDIDLDRLFKHSTNISRLTNAEDWDGLHKEQVNASRTIQQVKANIKEIERTRNQVKDEDLPNFDEKVQEVKSKAVCALEEFMTFVGMVSSQTPQTPDKGFADKTLVESGKGDYPQAVKIPFVHKNSTHSPEDNSGVMFDSFGSGSSSQTPYGSLPATLTVMPAPLLTTSLHVVPNSSQASASWEQLQENIVELNEIVHDFATRVEQQGEMINNIEDNIESAHENVRQGTKHLAKTAKYKAAIFPVVGAVVGGAFGGPIGLVAGLKIGSIAGAVGGVVGFAGGRLIKKHQEKISDLEMKNLSDKRSLSLPDLPDNVRQDKNVAINEPRKNEQPKASTDNTEETDTAEETDVFTSMTTSVKKIFSFSDAK